MKDKEELMKAVEQCTGSMHDVEPIDINDSFGFTCKQCGKCCINRGDIILNPFDIYNAAKYLGITTEEFIKNYTVSMLGNHSKIPMVLLKDGDNGFCPLLEFDIKDGGKFKCKIHPAKPGACANHPIGVVYSLNKTTGENSIQYIKVEQCPNSVSNEMHTVKDWLKPYLDHQEEIDMAHKLQHLITDYFNPRDFWATITILKEMMEEAPKEILRKEAFDTFKEISKELLSRYIVTSNGVAYAEYDTDKPFIPQAEENIKTLDKFYTDTKKLYELIKGFIVKVGCEEELNDLINSDL